jgi:hypothetical protein
MSDAIRQKIEDSKWNKYEGIAPDGFILVPTELIERLRDFDEWKEFKHDPNWIADKSKEIVKAWP